MPDNKQTILELGGAIFSKSREVKVNQIIKWAGDEYESREDYINLAVQSNVQLNRTLEDIRKYYIQESKTI